MELVYRQQWLGSHSVLFIKEILCMIECKIDTLQQLLYGCVLLAIEALNEVALLNFYGEREPVFGVGVGVSQLQNVFENRHIRAKSVFDVVFIHHHAHLFEVVDGALSKIGPIHLVFAILSNQKLEPNTNVIGELIITQC